jgi:hypothetical protein
MDPLIILVFVLLVGFIFVLLTRWQRSSDSKMTQRVVVAAIITDLIAATIISIITIITTTKMAAVAAGSIEAKPRSRAEVAQRFPQDTFGRALSL